MKRPEGVDSGRKGYEEEEQRLGSGVEDVGRLYQIAPPDEEAQCLR